MTKETSKSPTTDASPQLGEKANFYEHAMSEAETEYLKRATNMDGLDDEIAVLRAKILTALEDRPDDLPLLMKGIAALSRTLAAHHRLGGKAQDDLFDNLVGTLRGLGEQIFPGPEDDIEL